MIAMNDEKPARCSTQVIAGSSQLAWCSANLVPRVYRAVRGIVNMVGNKVNHGDEVGCSAATDLFTNNRDQWAQPSLSMRMEEGIASHGACILDSLTKGGRVFEISPKIRSGANNYMSTQEESSVIGIQSDKRFYSNFLRFKFLGHITNIVFDNY